MVLIHKEKNKNISYFIIARFTAGAVNIKNKKV